MEGILINMAKPKAKVTEKGTTLNVNDILNTTSTEDAIIKNYVARHANRIGKKNTEKKPTTYRS